MTQVAEQIRAAQQKAALGGQAPAAWAIGGRCQAVWSGDGGWYSGAVTGVSAGGNFIVSFDEDGGVEEVRARRVYTLQSLCPRVCANVKPYA